MFKSIVVPLDTQKVESWGAILPAALSMVRTNEARVTLCTVVPNLHGMLGTEWSATGDKSLGDVAHERLAGLTKQYLEFASAKIEVASGSVWRGIVEVARKADADLIVLASHKPTASDYMFGANGVSVVQHAPCSVMVVRP